VGYKIKGIQSYRPQTQETRFFPMQNEATIAWEDGILAAEVFISNIGEQGRVRKYSGQIEAGVWGLRAGRFLPPFGLLDPNHMLATRKVWVEADQATGYYRGSNFALFLSSYPVFRFEGYSKKAMVVASFSSDHQSAALLFSPFRHTTVMIEAADYAHYAKLNWELTKGLDFFGFLDDDQPGIGAKVTIISNLELTFWATQELMFVVGGISL